MKDNLKRNYDEEEITENKRLDNGLIECPVCGNLVDTYDVCEVCTWENSGIYNIDGGAQQMTLREAKIAYKEGKPIY